MPAAGTYLSDLDQRRHVALARDVGLGRIGRIATLTEPCPHTLADLRIRLVGFVTPQEPGGDGYLLTRFAINCCTADATALEVAVHGDPVSRASDTWLEVEGRWQQRTNDHPSSEIPLLAESIRVIGQPSPTCENGFPY